MRNPRATAAVAPSSRLLAQRMLEGVDFARVRTVVEYGPGTGVFTDALLAKLDEAWNDRARVIVFELNGEMARRLKDRFGDGAGRVDVRHADALDARRALTEMKLHGADLVISGLGWPSLPAGVRRRLVGQTARILAAGGTFRTFGYHVGLTMPGAWEFRRLVRARFERVEVSRVVWANLPPAFVYRCDIGPPPVAGSGGGPTP